MHNDHVAEPFKRILRSIDGGNAASIKDTQGADVLVLTSQQHGTVALEDAMRDTAPIAQANVDASHSQPPQPTRDYTGVPNDTLASAIFHAQQMLASKTVAFDNATREIRSDITDMRACLAGRMEADHATVLAHDDLDVTYEQKTDLDKRISVLRELEGLVPAEELGKALTVEIMVSIPPELYTPVTDALRPLVNDDKIKPTWKANAVKLKPLHKFGDKVREILSRGLVQVPIGRPVLKIVEKKPALTAPRNITPIQSDEGGAQ